MVCLVFPWRHPVLEIVDLEERENAAEIHVEIHVAAAKTVLESVAKDEQQSQDFLEEQTRNETAYSELLTAVVQIAVPIEIDVVQIAFRGLAEAVVDNIPVPVPEEPVVAVPVRY